MVGLRYGRPVALSIAAIAFVLAPFCEAAEPNAQKGPLEENRVVAGGPKDFLEVRHLVLRGSNEAIGRELASIAKSEFKVEPAPSKDPLRTRVQRRYIEKNYPILAERMRGAAAAYGKRFDDDSLNFSSLWYLAFQAGCSVMHFPASLTATGESIISRDYDFTTGTLYGTKPPAGALAATARPFVVEMYPDRGYASIALYSYDLLSGALDGMNSEGLTVAILADDELHMKYKMEPTGESEVGLGVLQIARFLLDTCSNVDEAKEALLSTKQYYELISVHYLIADRHGKSFVWEYSQAHNSEFIIENPGSPLVTTNFCLHTRLNGTTPPSAAKVKNVCPRYCALCDRLSNHKDKMSIEFIKDCHKLADAVQPASSSYPPTRTLWHALYFPEKRKMQISFYLHDEPDSADPKKSRIVRSDYLEFALKGGKTGE